MSAEIKKLPVEPVDRSLFTCPHCDGKFKREPYMPIIFTSDVLNVRVTKCVFEFECPHCDGPVEVTFPSTRAKAPVVPLRKKKS